MRVQPLPLSMLLSFAAQSCLNTVCGDGERSFSFFSQQQVLEFRDAGIAENVPLDGAPCVLLCAPIDVSGCRLETHCTISGRSVPCESVPSDAAPQTVLISGQPWCRYTVCSSH